MRFAQKNDSLKINGTMARIPTKLGVMANHPRLKLAIQLSLSALIPTIPILIWSNNAKREREERSQEVSTKIR